MVQRYKKNHLPPKMCDRRSIYVMIAPKVGRTSVKWDEIPTILQGSESTL